VKRKKIEGVDGEEEVDVEVKGEERIKDVEEGSETKVDSGGKGQSKKRKKGKSRKEGMQDAELLDKKADVEPIEAPNSTVKEETPPKEVKVEVGTSTSASTEDVPGRRRSQRRSKAG